jgi:hypothetical protein
MSEGGKGMLILVSSADKETVDLVWVSGPIGTYGEETVESGVAWFFLVKCGGGTTDVVGDG